MHQTIKKFILSRWSPNLTDVKIFLFQPTLSTAGIRIFLITSVRLGDEMRLGDWVEEISMPSPSRISSHVPTKAPNFSNPAHVRSLLGELPSLFLGEYFLGWEVHP